MTLYTIDRQYEDLLERVLVEGTHKNDRTGTGTVSIFGTELRYDLVGGRLPVVTTKKVFLKGVIHELLWLLRGDTDIGYLNENGVHIWDEWADEHGELGPVYGAQWRRWRAYSLGENAFHRIDQMARLVEELRLDPDSRRHVVSAWNVGELDEMALAPCHYSFQCDVTAGRLSLIVNQRSCDLFLGVPFNITSYAILTHMLAQQSGHEPGELIWRGGDTHVYLNHRAQVDEQLLRDPHPFPTLKLYRAPSLFSYGYADVVVENYRHHPAIAAPISV